ncbi:MAG: hypothetical protein IKB93_01715 [Clostridia bacterium]|nr:hypothetical protein [Clostridia bacterium]
MLCHLVAFPILFTVDVIGAGNAAAAAALAFRQPMPEPFQKLSHDLPLTFHRFTARKISGAKIKTVRKQKPKQLNNYPCHQGCNDNEDKQEDKNDSSVNQKRNHF